MELKELQKRSKEMERYIRMMEWVGDMQSVWRWELKVRHGRIKEKV